MPELLTMSMFATKADLEAAKAAQKAAEPKYTEDCFILRNTETAFGASYMVIQFKTAGLNKGEQVIATLCGGNLGKVLATAVIKQAMEMTMIDLLINEVE